MKAQRRKRPKRAVETDDFRRFAGRIVAAMGRRAGRDIQYLGELASLALDVNTALAKAVLALRREDGHSWAELAAELGVSKQAVQVRFGKRWKGE